MESEPPTTYVPFTEYDPVHVLRFEYDVSVFRFDWTTIDASFLLFSDVTVTFSLTDA